jgi:DNA-binding transcriptional ArsR family regulator
MHIKINKAFPLDRYRKWCKIFDMTNMKGLQDPKLIESFRILSNPVRLKILNGLLVHPSSVDSLSIRLKKRQSNISQHLQILRKNNLVKFNKSGRKRVYLLGSEGERLISYFMKFKS